MAGTRKTVRIVGLKKIQKDLTKMIEKELPKKVGDLHLKRAKRQLKQRIIHTDRSTGNLHKSLKMKPTKGKYSVYSNEPYARIQNLGGKIKITAKMIRFFWYMFKKTGNRMWKNFATTKKSHFVIKAKHYMDIPPKAYRRMLNRQINKLIKKI